MAPSFRGVRSIASMGFLTKNTSSTSLSPTTLSPEYTETGSFTLPTRCVQVREHLHGSVPDTLPSALADVHEVRYFLYHVLTLKVDLVGKKWPQWVLETCAAWNGTGADLRNMDAPKLRLLCPTSRGRCIIYGREELELTCPPQCRTEIGQVIERAVSRLKHQEKTKETLHTQWQQTRTGGNTAQRLVEGRTRYNKWPESASRSDARGLGTIRPTKSAVTLHAEYAQTSRPCEDHFSQWETDRLRTPTAKSAVSGMTMHSARSASQQSRADQQRHQFWTTTSAASTISAASFQSARSTYAHSMVQNDTQMSPRDGHQDSHSTMSVTDYHTAPTGEAGSLPQSVQELDGDVSKPASPSPSRPPLSAFRHSSSRVSSSTRSSSGSYPTASARSDSTAPTSPSTSVQETQPFPSFESRGFTPSAAPYHSISVLNQTPSSSLLDTGNRSRSGYSNHNNQCCIKASVSDINSPLHMIPSNLETGLMNLPPESFYRPEDIWNHHPHRPLNLTHSANPFLAINASAVGDSIQRPSSCFGSYGPERSATSNGKQRHSSGMSQTSAPIPSRYVRGSQSRTPFSQNSFELPGWFSSLEPAPPIATITPNSMNYPRSDIYAPRETLMGRGSRVPPSQVSTFDQGSGRATPRGRLAKAPVEDSLKRASRADQYALRQAQLMILKNTPSPARDELLYQMSREHGLDSNPDRMGPCVRYTSPGNPDKVVPTLVETIREREILAGRGKNTVLYSSQRNYGS